MKRVKDSRAIPHVNTRLIPTLLTEKGELRGYPGGYNTIFSSLGGYPGGYIHYCTPSLGGYPGGIYACVHPSGRLPGWYIPPCTPLWEATPVGIWWYTQGVYIGWVYLGGIPGYIPPYMPPYYASRVHTALYTTLCTPRVHHATLPSPLVVHASANDARRRHPGLKTGI